MAFAARLNAPRMYIDSSYVYYHTFYGIIRTYNKKFDIDVESQTSSFEIGDDPEFRAMFRKKFNYDMMNIAKKFMTQHDWSRFIFAIDCPGHEIWRNELHPTYKAGRVKVNKQYQGSQKVIKRWFHDTLIPEMVELGASSIAIPNAECDDIIGVVMRRDPYENNVAITSDHDYIQLRDFGTIMTLEGRNLTEEFPDAKRSLMEKCLTGDKSDNITQAFVKCGPATAAKFMDNHEFRAKKLAEHPDIMSIVKFNKSLIDMKEIPLYIQKDIAKAWVKLREEKFSND